VSTTYRELQDDVLRLIALSGDEDARTFVKRALNDAAEAVWRAHAWRERIVTAFVNTVAPYTTGTATFTNGSTAVAAGGTASWSSTYEGYKIAKSYSEPYYAVSTYNSSADTFTIDRAYLETTASGSTYVLYDDVLEIADCDALLANSLIVFKGGGGYDDPLDDLTSQGWDRLGHFPRSSGVPTAFRQIEDKSDGTRQIQVWPVPDATYAIRYRYLKTYTDMKSDGDTCLVPESRVDLVRSGALVQAYKYNEEYNKAGREYGMFQDMLRGAIKEEKSLHPQAVILRPVTNPSKTYSGFGRIAIDWNNL